VELNSSVYLSRADISSMKRCRKSRRPSKLCYKQKSQHTHCIQYIYFITHIAGLLE